MVDLSTRSWLALISSLFCAAVGTVSAGLPQVSVVPSDDASLETPVPRSASLTPAQVLDMVRRAVDLLGGMGAIVPDTARLVVIKPNIVTLDPPGSGVVTDARLVRAVALLVHEVAPMARLLIAEGGAGWSPPTDGFETAGHRATVAELRARGIEIECFDLNFDEALTLAVPGGGLAAKSYDIAATILDADVWINCPVAKTHGAKITCSMKNQIGVLPGRLYGWPKSSGTEHHAPMPHAPRVMDELLVDLLLTTRPDLNVVDMIAGVEAGAFKGAPKRSNLIVAGRNAVATDLVVARLMGFNPRDLELGDLAWQRNAGPRSLDHVEVRGADLGPLVSRFKKAGLSYGYIGTYGEWGEHADYGMGPRRWTVLGPLPRDHQFTADEISSLAPEPGRSGWSPITWFGHDKIDLDALFSDPVNVSAYAYVRFTMDRPDSVRFWIGSGEALQIWIDREPLYGYDGRRHHRLGQVKLKGFLTAGGHRLLVRAEQGRGTFDFSVNICESVDDPLYAGNTHPGIRWSDGAREPAAFVRAQDVFEGHSVPEYTSTLPQPSLPPSPPDSVSIDAPPVGAGSLLNVLATVAGSTVSETDSVDLACLSRAPFGLSVTTTDREVFHPYGPEPARLLSWLGLDFAISSGLGWAESLKEIRKWVATGRPAVVAIENEWVPVTGYRARDGVIQLAIETPEGQRWVAIDADWWGALPGDVRVSCPVFVVSDAGGCPKAAALDDSVATLALEMGRRASVDYAPEWWHASPAPAGLAAWDALVVAWERLQWGPEFAEAEGALSRLISARQSLGHLARGRRIAAGYFSRAAMRSTGDRRSSFADAAAAYGRVADILDELVERLPEGDERGGLGERDVARMAAIADTRSLLRRARQAERDALQALAGHLSAPPLPPVSEDPLRHKASGRRLFTWRADHNHGLYEVTLSDGQVRQRLLSGRDADGTSHQVFASPPTDTTWQIAVEAVKGGGVYEVIVRPDGDDGTVTLRVDDRLANFVDWWVRRSFETELTVWAVPR